MATVAPVLPLPQPAPSVPATTAVARDVGNGFRDMMAEATDREPAAQLTRDAGVPQRTERIARSERPDRSGHSGKRQAV